LSQEGLTVTFYACRQNIYRNLMSGNLKLLMLNVSKKKNGNNYSWKMPIIDTHW